MNGNLTNWLLGLVGASFSLLFAIVSWIVSQHLKSDLEHRHEIAQALAKVEADLKAEILMARKRIHDALNEISALKAVIRMRDKDRNE